MEQYFFIDANNQQQGPVDVNELRRLGVTKETFVWKEGMESWLTAGSIAELARMFPPAIPNKPPKPEPPAIPQKENPIGTPSVVEDTSKNEIINEDEFYYSDRKVTISESAFTANGSVYYLDRIQSFNIVSVKKYKRRYILGTIVFGLLSTMAFEDDKLLAKLGYFSIASFVYNLIYLFISYDSGIRIKTDSSEVIALTSHKSDYINSIYVILNEVMKKRMETLQKKQTIYKQIK